MGSKDLARIMVETVDRSNQWSVDMGMPWFEAPMWKRLVDSIVLNESILGVLRGVDRGSQPNR